MEFLNSLIEIFKYVLYYVDFSIWPTLWVGTSLGSIIVISIIIPVGGKEARKSEPVSVAPSGTIFRIKGLIITFHSFVWILIFFPKKTGPILMMSFLDCNGLVVSGGYESWRDESKDPRSSESNFPSVVFIENVLTFINSITNKRNKVANTQLLI